MNPNLIKISAMPKNSTLISIPGDPIPLKRHRSTLRKGRMSQYDPQLKEKLNFVRKIKSELKSSDHLLELASKNSYQVTIIFGMPYPKSKIRKCMPPLSDIPHVCKPDIDNLVKFVLDCGNRLLWSDDKRITKLVCKKIYVEDPKTVIMIE